MTIKIYFRTAAALLALAAGCSAIGGDPKENEVRAGAALVRRTLDATKQSPAAGMAFASTAEQGGSVLSYIAASLPDGAKFTCYLEGGEKKPYCVSIRPGAASSPGCSAEDEGHEWLQTEDGFAKVAAVWEKYPELRNTPDPVRSALGYIPNIPSNAQQRGPAQSTGLTPILGASGAVPPVTSTPAASKVDKLATMLTEVQRLQSLGAVQESRNLLAEMDKIERGI